MKKLFYILTVLMISQLGFAQTKVKSLIIENRPTTQNDTTKIDILVRENEGAGLGNVRKITWPYFSSLVNLSVIVDAIPTDGSNNAVASNGVFDALALKSPLASPVFTGNPTVPNQTAGDSDGSAANTLFVQTAANAKIENNLTASTTVGASKTAINTALSNKADLSGGKVPLSQIPEVLLGAVNYQGTYNATTNTPALPSASGNKGFYYVVNTAGTVGGINYTIGDWIISNGTIWDKVIQTFPVDATVVDGSNNAVAGNAVFDALALKQNSLVSGTNIKTVGGQSLVGSGNITEVQNSMTASTVLAPSVTATNAAINAKVEDNLTASTTVAPSKTAVNTALALKANDNNVMHLTGNETAGGTKTFANPAIYGGTNFESTLGDWVSVKNKLVSGNWARGFNITDTAGATYAEFGVYGTGQTFNYAYLGLGSNPSASAPIKYTSTGVGINLPLVTTPTVPLEVNGTVLIKDGSGGTQLKIERGTGGVYFSQLLNTDRLILANKANTLTYETWFEDGNITIGGSTNAAYKLDVQGTGRYTGKLIAANFEVPFGAASSSRSWMIRNDLNSSGDFSIGTYSDKTNTTFINRIWISPVGNVSIGNNADNSFKLDVTGNAIIRGTATVNNAPVSSTDVARKLELDTKQATLVSGTNIKTINGTTLLGSGDIAVDGRPYKVYTALLTQSGTSAPVATILENTLGGIPTWGYTAAGQYTATLTGVFTNLKTAVFLNGYYSSTSATNMQFRASRFSNDVVNVYTNLGGTSLDAMLSNGSVIEIRVYN